MKLNVRALALTTGLLWGFGLFFLTWWIILFEGSTGQTMFIGHIYRGYNISPVGSVYGLLWGLPDGAIGGALLGWIYNFLNGKFSGAARL